MMFLQKNAKMPLNAIKCKHLKWRMNSRCRKEKRFRLHLELIYHFDLFLFGNVGTKKTLIFFPKYSL
jgi:hypothetical protein